MKLLIIFAALVALAYSSPVLQQSDSNDENDVEIAQDAEKHYKMTARDIMEDAKLLIPEIITKYGYPSEVHKVVSKDGYLLEMHRIPYGIKGPSKDRPAVYLQHGILASSADWVLAGPGQGFAYILADAGYDVWMPNARGTRYSRAHKTLDPDENAKDFWDFSWHEIALNDVTAMVDHVIAQTKQKEIFYVAHSQGSTVFFVLLSEKPEYNNKIRAMFALAPIGYMKHITSPIMKIGALFEPVAATFAKWFGMHEFLPHSTLIGSVGATLCGDDSIFQMLCTNSLFAVCGFNKNQMNTTILPVIMAHTPAGTSTKQFLHFAQEINSGYFRKYDYGSRQNKKLYGKRKPPSYNLKNVKAPIYFHYSKNDWMTGQRDVLKLYNELPNVKGKFLSPDKKFNHADFLYGIDAPALLYNRVISLMKRH